MFEIVYFRNGEEVYKEVTIFDIFSYLNLHKRGKIIIKSIKKDDFSYDPNAIILKLKL